MKLPGRRARRVLIVLVPILALLLWYGSDTLGHAANLRLFTIPPASNSMAPALLPGDRFTVDTRGGTPGRGEIWIFRGEGGVSMVKRVIGLPGESVEVAGGQVVIDGKPLAERYPTAPMTYSMAPILLGPDQYFLLGDGRNASLDGHVWGPLDRRHLIGRAEARIWPQARIGAVR